MSRPARFEVVRTDAGFHARFRAAGNLRTIWWSETYRRKADALRAVELMAGISVDWLYGKQRVLLGRHGYTEVRDVDLRGPDGDGLVGK